jgi:hypothetical protein
MADTKQHLNRYDSERLDSEVGMGAGPWFARQLEQIEAEILRVKRPAKSGLILFPIKTGIAEGADTYTRRIYEHLGRAKLVGSYASDLPRADVAGSEESVKMKRLGASYGYNIDELAASDFSSSKGGISLPIERAIAARDAIELKLNDLTWHGDEDAGLYGVLNHPYIPRYHLGTASTGTVDTIISDIAAVFHSVADDTKEVEKADRLLMASRLRNYLSTRLRTNTDSSILNILAKTLGISEDAIVGVHELNGAGEGGGDVVIADRKDELVMAHVLSVPFRQEPVERRNLEFIINCTAKSGGMLASYPLGCRIAEFPNAL